MGLVQTNFSIAHDHDEQLAVVAEGDLDGSQVVAGRYQLFHHAFFGFDDVQAHRGAQGEEMIEPVISPDRREAEVVGRARRSGDESILVLAVVVFHHEHAASAAEHGHVAVAGVAVKVGAAFGAVQ